jgi:NMD protein affecting ribosome stability and mRNA decay
MKRGGEATGTRRHGRRDRLIRDSRHDPYRAERKPQEPTVCPDCGVVFREGRWRWAAGPVDAPRVVCPACQRIRDDYPAGYVTVTGEFATSHREEIIALARNVETRERAEHPLKRIIDAREEDDDLVITTTDVHLARSIGDSLHAAYAGELESDYAKDENLVRLRWSR